MRRVAVALVLAACFGKHDVVGTLCDGDRPCPDMLFCVAGRCQTTAGDGGGTGEGGGFGGSPEGGGSGGGLAAGGGIGGGATGIKDGGQPFAADCDAGGQCGSGRCLEGHCSGKASELTDDFPGVIDMKKWQVVQTGGTGSCISFDDAGVRLSVAPGAGQFDKCELESRFPVDLTDSYIMVKIDASHITSGIAEYEFQTHAVAGQSTVVLLGNPNATIARRVYNDGGRDDVTWNGFAAGALRLREDGGTVYWDVRPSDGGAFQTMTSYPTSLFALTQTHVSMMTTIQNASIPQSVAFDDVNR